LLGQQPPRRKTAGAQVVFDLEPGAAFCLATSPRPTGLAGDDYRRARAQSAWAIAALSRVLLPEEIGPCDWRALAARVHANPRDFLAALPYLDRARARADLCGALDEAAGKFPRVVELGLIDTRRVTPVPPGHWLLLRDPRGFRATLDCGGRQRHVEAIEVRDGFAACFAPQPEGGAADAELIIERHGLTTERVKAAVRFLAAAPALVTGPAPPPPSSLVLLTNGRGGMARLCVDLGNIQSKYDCALGANLDPEFPVDRHVFVKRIRVWVSADGFITALNLQNLASFQPGPPAVWNFVAEAGDGRTVEIQLAADMLENWNTSVFTFARRPGTRPADLPPRFEVRLTVRADIEDRSFHGETHRNGGAESHFTRNCRELPGRPGFEFTPAQDRQLRVFSNTGLYHSQPEWCLDIPHPVEQSRGQDPFGDAYSPGWLDLPLTQGKSVTVVLSADLPPPTWELVRNSPACRRQVEVIEIPGGQFVAKTIGLARKIAADWANRHIRGVFINKDTSWAIQIGSNGLSKTLSGVRDFAQDHLEAVVALPKLLQEAKLEGSRPDRAGDPNIKALHVFRQPLSIGDRDYSAKLTVKETNDGRYFYDHSLSQLEREPAGISMDDAKGSAPHGPQTGFPQVKMASSAQNVKETPDPKLAALKSDTQGNVFDAVRRAAFPEDDAFGRQLALAARAFVVRRGAGRTIIAGYPWFLDWGRDSLISARGLLAAGMISEVQDLLATFGRLSAGGLLPNSLNGGDASNRDTADAPLWYGVVCEEAAALNKNIYDTPAGAAGRTTAGVLRETGDAYARGTANGIRMDPASALIWSPPHFTWMDTNFPACTPREGYPVEIQALWIRLLRQLDRLGDKPSGEPWRVLADRAEESLQKLFWLEETGYMADVLIARPGQSAAAAVPDNALRGNYLWAIAFGYVTGAPARRAVAAALRYLFVPGALRSLAPLPVWPPLEIRRADGQLLGQPREPYQGRYEGDEDTRRKPAYHNGTAWTWTLPVACEALALAWDSAPAAVAAARAYLAGMDRLLMGGCLGQLPEILDGDAPHQPRGCDAQAWSALEALRVWKWLNSL
jgi:hypothetical protein